jgi:hypothetical protein
VAVKLQRDAAAIAELHVEVLRLRSAVARARETVDRLGREHAARYFREPTAKTD